MRTTRVAVPGLTKGAQALNVRATLVVGGSPTRLRLLLVPPSVGIVAVSARADDATAQAVLASVAAR